VSGPAAADTAVVNCTNSSTDTTAIRNAISGLMASVSNPGTVTVDAGTCSITGQISIPSYVTLQGKGAMKVLSGGTPEPNPGGSSDITVLSAYTTSPGTIDPTFVVLAVGSSTTSASKVTLKKFTVLGNASPTLEGYDGILVEPGGSGVLVYGECQ